MAYTHPCIAITMALFGNMNRHVFMVAKKKYHSSTQFNKGTKYQGVKEFHMLARIGCYCKIMVFSPLKLEVTYYHSSKAIKP